MLPVANHLRQGYGGQDVAVTAPLIDIAYGDSSLQLVGGYPCGGSRPIGRCACAEGVRLAETAGRAAKRAQGPTRTRRAKRVPNRTGLATNHFLFSHGEGRETFSDHEKHESGERGMVLPNPCILKIRVIKFCVEPRFHPQTKHVSRSFGYASIISLYYFPNFVCHCSHSKREKLIV